MGKKPNVVSAILIALGFLFINLVAGGCSSSPIRGYNTTSTDDQVTAESMTWKRWQKTDGSLIKAEIVLQQDLDSATQQALFTAEDGAAHGPRGLLLDQVRPGVILVEVEPTSKDRPAFQGHVHGNTVKQAWIRRGAIRSWILDWPPISWIFGDTWGQLSADALDGSGTANVLNKHDDPNSRCTCHIFLCRNEEEYQEHAKHVEGLLAEFPTLVAYLANYPDRVVVETPVSSGSGGATAAASTGGARLAK